MSLALVQAVIATTAGLILTWTALMITVALALPIQTEKAEQALATAPMRCVWRGLAALVVFVVASQMSSKGGLVSLLGLGGLMVLGVVLTVGAAGLTQLMARRIGEMASTTTTFGALLRGGLVFSAALGFPLIGWFIFLPLATLFALGAGVTALWPRKRPHASTLSPLAVQTAENAG